MLSQKLATHGNSSPLPLFHHCDSIILTIPHRIGRITMMLETR
jgi:hypothetical protein